MKRKVLGIVAIAAIALSLAGCSANKGADTSCGEFNSMDNSGQKSVIKTLLEAEGQSTGVLNMGSYLLSAKAYCALSDDSATLQGLNGD